MAENLDMIYFDRIQFDTLLAAIDNFNWHEDEEGTLKIKIL